MIRNLFRYDSRLVSTLGKIAIGMAAFFFLAYHYLWLSTGRPTDEAQLLSAIVLALLGLIALVVARCLRNIEERLSQQRKNGV